MRFVNYSNRTLTAVPTFCQNGGDSRWAKPIGLWFSVVDENGNDSWKVTCRAKSIDLKPQPHATEIIFKHDARILWLSNAVAIDRLTTEHGFFPEYHESQSENPNYTRSAIRWDRVAEQYDGVIAAPHCAARHQEQHWYFTWDCASGCIWNLDPVAAEGLIPRLQAC
jgi:hypothetical protein